MSKPYLSSKDGATAIECALIAIVLVLAILAGATEVGRLLGESDSIVASQFFSLLD